MAQTIAAPTAQERYSHLETERSIFLDRARRVSKVTIPALFEEPNEFRLDYQSLGSRCVNNLAAKLHLALFPPAAKFFRLRLDEFVLDELAGMGPDADEQKIALEKGLAKIEKAVAGSLEKSGFRAPTALALKHLVVGGNGCLQRLPSGRWKFHSLRDYVVKRDLAGNLIEGIIKESLSRSSLPPEVRELVPESPYKDDDEHADVDIYTRFVKVKKRWMVTQEIEGVVIPKSNANYPEDKLPFLVLRYITVAGEDYGRGYAEEYLGDLLSYDSLQCSMVEFAAVAAKIVFMVDESNLTQKRDLEEASHGAIIDGNAKDVTTLQLEKSQDFTIAKQVADDIGRRLEQAFLMYSSVQRQAERVTAEEIRLMAGELEQSQGGIYSILTEDLQLPMLALEMAQMQRENKLPQLPKDTVVPTIVTGLEGLGRNTDLQQLQTFIQSMLVFGPDAVSEYFHVGNIGTRLGTSLGVDTSGIIRSDKEVEQRRAQAAQQALQEKAVGPVINAQAAAAQTSAQAA